MEKENSFSVLHNHFIILAAILIAIDQLTKYIAASYIPFDTVICSFLGFGLTYTMNKGLIFGIGKQYEYTNMVPVIVSIIILPIILLAYRFYIFKYRKSTWINLSLAFAIASIIGNDIDRVFLGYVRDFIIWPGPGTPNIADICIDIAILCLIVELKKNPEIDSRGFNFKADSQVLREFIFFSKKEIKECCKHALTNRSRLR